MTINVDCKWQLRLMVVIIVAGFFCGVTYFVQSLHSSIFWCLQMWLQWNGGPFFTLWEIFGCMCCMRASSNWNWSRFIDTSTSRFLGGGYVPDQTPHLFAPSLVRASYILPWRSNVKLQPVHPFNFFELYGRFNFDHSNVNYIYAALVWCLYQGQFVLLIV